MSKYLLIKCDDYNKEAVENFKAVELTKEELEDILKKYESYEFEHSDSPKLRKDNSIIVPKKVNVYYKIDKVLE